MRLAADSHPQIVAPTNLQGHDLALLNALRAASNHPTTNDLYEQVRAQFPQIGLATVYRSLQRLEAAGHIFEVRRDRAGRHYDARTERHDHAICTFCGRMIDLPPAPAISLDTLSPLVHAARAAGISVASYEVRVTGMCTECARNTVAGRSALSAQEVEA